jgi:hypothetical protein
MFSAKVMKRIAEASHRGEGHSAEGAAGGAAALGYIEREIGRIDGLLGSAYDGSVSPKKRDWFRIRRNILGVFERQAR